MNITLLFLSVLKTYKVKNIIYLAVKNYLEPFYLLFEMGTRGNWAETPQCIWNPFLNVFPNRGAIISQYEAPELTEL